MSYYVQLPDNTYVEVPDDVSNEEAFKRIYTAFPQFAPQEKQSAFRQVADVPLQVGAGALAGVRMVADFFGAGSETASNLKAGEEYITQFLSAQSKKDSAEMARIQAEAKGKGLYQEVLAGLKALTVAPVDVIANSLGVGAPTLAAAALTALTGGGSLAAATAAGAAGAAMAAGGRKGDIYDEVKQVLTEQKLDPKVVEERAQEAQAYNGKNLDQILIGAGLGAADALTGASRILRNVATKAAGRAVVGTEKEVGRGILKRTGIGALEEAPLEALQGGQEQLAQNIAVQREGIDRPTWEGVASKAALEGGAGLLMGGATSAAFGKRPEPIIPPTSISTAPPSPNTAPGGGIPPAPLPAPGLPSTGGPLATPGSVAQTLNQPPGAAATPAGAQQLAQATAAQQLAAQTGALGSAPQAGPTTLVVPPPTDLFATSATPLGIAPAPTQAAPAIAPITSAKLPPALSNSTPFFGTNGGNVALTFENDIDRALYIVRDQKKKSKAHDKYIEWLMGQGFTASGIKKEAAKVKSGIKSLLNMAPGVDYYHVPPIFTPSAPKAAPIAQTQQQPPEIQQLIQALQAQQQPPVGQPPVGQPPIVEPPTTAPVTTAAPLVEPPVVQPPVEAPQFNLAAPQENILVKTPVPFNPTPEIHKTKILRTNMKDVSKIEVAPMVVELSDVVSSEVPGYEKTLQPRNRDQVASESWITETATKDFDPEMLMFDPSADRGAPIVNQNGHVESGNGRIMLLRSVYGKQDQTFADAYKQELIKNGFDISGMRNPVLVQRRLTPLSASQIADFTETQNKEDKLAMGATEVAVNDAKKITLEMLDAIPPGRNYTHPDFISKMMSKFTKNERGKLIDANGNLSKEGIQRVRNAVFAKAYGDVEAIRRMSEREDDNTKSITNALLDNAAIFAKLRAEIDRGNISKEFSFEPLLDAINRISEMRDENIKLENYLAQKDAFDTIPAMTEKFMRLFFSEKSRALGREKISNGLRFYAIEALKDIGENADKLGIAKKSSSDVLDEAIKVAHGVEFQEGPGLFGEMAPVLTENIQPPTVETAPPLAAVTVVEKKRIKLNDVDGYATRVTFSDGTVSEIQRMDSSTTMGLPGWHDLSKGLMEFSYLGDTEERAIQELLQRRNAEKFAPMTTTPLDENILDSVKKTTHLKVGQDTREFLDKHLPGVIDVIREAQYRLYPGTTFSIEALKQKTPETDYGSAYIMPQGTDITLYVDNLMEDFKGKSFEDKLMHTLIHEFAHPIQYSWIHTASEGTQLAVYKQFKRERSGTAVQRASLVRYIINSQQPGFDLEKTRSNLLNAFDLTESQYKKLLETQGDIAEKNALYRERVSSEYLRSFSEWVAEKGAQWLSKELQGRLPNTAFEKFQATILKKLRDTYEVLAKIMGIPTREGAFEKLLSDIWGVKTTTPFAETGSHSDMKLPADQRAAYDKAIRLGDSSGIEQLPGGQTAKLNSERWSKVTGSVREFFDPWFTVDKFPILSEFRNLLFGRIGMATQKAKELSGIISKGTQEVQTQTYTYLTTRNADPSLITDEKVRAAAVEVKKEINRTALELVQKGYITEDSLAKYYDQYLPRMYLYYEMTGRGIKTSNMGISPREYLDLRKEIPEDLRQLLGEIKNPAFLSYVAISRPQVDLAKMDYFNQIVRQTGVRWIAPNTLVDFNGQKVTPYWLANEAKIMRELGKLTEATDPAGSQAMYARANELQLAADQVLGTLSDEVPDGYKRIPDSASYGALRGAIVQKGIYDDILGNFVSIPLSEKPLLQRLFGDERSTLVKANQVWKMMKVVLNLPSQARNIVSNAIAMNFFGGIPFYRVAPLLLRASKEISENGDFWKEAQKYGITGGTMSSAELIQMRATLEQYLRKGGGKDMMGAFAAARIAAGNAVGAASDLYQKTEVLFKMAMFIHERSKPGVSASQAVDAANEVLFDYTKVNPNVRFLRNFPLGLPFITYYYKVLPKLVETAYKHPLRLVPYVALAASIPYMTMAALDIDSDDYESLRKTMAEFVRNKGSVYIVPWKNEKGAWEYIDLAPFFPWSSFTDPIIQATLRQDPKGALGEAAKLITPSGPVVTVLAALTTGRDPFTDKEIIDPRQTPANKALALMTYVWNQTLPSMLAVDFVNPQNASGALPRLYNDVFGEGTGLDKRGQPKPDWLRDAARLFGANISPLEPVTQRALNINHMIAQVHASESLRAQIAKDQSMTPNKRMQEINSLNEKIREDYKKIQEYAQETARATSLKK